MPGNVDRFSEQNPAVADAYAAAAQDTTLAVPKRQWGEGKAGSFEGRYRAMIWLCIRQSQKVVSANMDENKYNIDMSNAWQDIINQFEAMFGELQQDTNTNPTRELTPEQQTWLWEQNPEFNGKPWREGVLTNVNKSQLTALIAACKVEKKNCDSRTTDMTLELQAAMAEVNMNYDLARAEVAKNSQKKESIIQTFS